MNEQLRKPNNAVVCSTCYEDVTDPHPGPNYCSRACEPWVLQRAHARIEELETFVSEIRDLASETTALSNHAVERWCTDVLTPRQSRTET